MKVFALTLCALLVTGGVVILILKNQRTTSLPGGPSSSVTSPDANTNRRPQNGSLLAPGSLVDLPVATTRIVISKRKRQLKLFSGRKLLRTYRIGLGFSPVNDKYKEGDGATPEGTFYIFTKNSDSSYYLSLGISYPNTEDAKRGLRNGLITEEQYQQIIAANLSKGAPPQDTPLGGRIYIHGNGSHKDWTLGCVALDDNDVLELFNAISVGTRVIIEH